MTDFDRSTLIPIPSEMSIPEGDLLHRYLAQIDQDPSWDNMVEALSTFGNIKNATQWMIGDTLFFYRTRAQYEIVKIFDWDGQEWPEEVSEFLKEKYGVRVDQATSEEFLCWNCLVFEGLRVLMRPGEIRVWEAINDIRLTEQQFEKYMAMLKPFVSVNDTSLYKYYRTSRIYPPSLREPKTWTWHYENTNWVAPEIPKSATGETRWKMLTAKVEAASVINQEKKAIRIREETTHRSNRMRGFSWTLEDPRELWIKKENGRTVVGLEFSPSTENGKKAVRSILYGLYLAKHYPGTYRLYYNEGLIELEDGEVIATCPDPEGLMGAMMHLMDRLKIKVRT